MSENCIFCSIRDGKVPSDMLYKGNNCFVIRDIAPRAPIHLLVIPNQHLVLSSGLIPKNYDMIGSMYQVAREMAKANDLADSGYRLIVNQGSDAGQAVDHLHLHVLGGRPLGEMG